MTDQKNLQAMKDESIAEIKNMLHEMEHLYENVKGETQEHTKEAKAKLKDRIAQARRKVEAYEVDAKQKASAALHRLVLTPKKTLKRPQALWRRQRFYWGFWRIKACANKL